MVSNIISDYIYFTLYLYLKFLKCSYLFVPTIATKENLYAMFFRAQIFTLFCHCQLIECLQNDYEVIEINHGQWPIVLATNKISREKNVLLVTTGKVNTILCLVHVFFLLNKNNIQFDELINLAHIRWKFIKSRIYDYI